MVFNNFINVMHRFPYNFQNTCQPRTTYSIHYSLFLFSLLINKKKQYFSYFFILNTNSAYRISKRLKTYISNLYAYYFDFWFYFTNNIEVNLTESLSIVNITHMLFYHFLLYWKKLLLFLIFDTWLSLYSLFIRIWNW